MSNMIKLNVSSKKWYKTTSSTCKNIFEESVKANSNMILFVENGLHEGEILKKYIDHVITDYCNELACSMIECKRKYIYGVKRYL